MAFFKKLRQRRKEKKALVAMYGKRGASMPTTVIKSHRAGKKRTR